MYNVTVATRLRCVGIFNDDFVTNMLLRLAAKCKTIKQQSTTDENCGDDVGGVGADWSPS